MSNKWEYKTYGIPDEYFIRGKVPMTKEEVRAISISKLRLNENDIVVDIGAGTGSVSIEAALVCNKGSVYSIEKNIDGVNLIKENMKHFNVKNINVISGKAPDVLEEVPIVDKAFIGGTGGNIEDIFSWLDVNLSSNGRIVINVITIENLYKSINLLKDFKYENIDVTNVSISKGKNIGTLTMMTANNPIYIISGNKR